MLCRAAKSRAQPADIVLTHRVLAKQREVQELTAILQEVLSSLCSCQLLHSTSASVHGAEHWQALQAKLRQEACSKEALARKAALQEKAEAFKPVISAVSKVTWHGVPGQLCTRPACFVSCPEGQVLIFSVLQAHEASRLWNERTAAAM